MINGKWKLIKETSARSLSFSAFLGFINPFLYYLVLFKAYDLLRAQEAVVLNYTWPVILVILSIPILKQRIRFLSFIAIFLSFLGMVVIATGGHIFNLKFNNMHGVSLAVGSAFLWGIFWLLNLKDKREDEIKICLNFFFGFLYILLFVVFTGAFEFPSSEGIIGSVYLGLFEMGITFIIWLKALKLSHTTAKVSNLIFLSPFLSLIVVHFTVGEDILFSSFIGLILIIGGIVLQEMDRSPEKV
jgi:drug/metabolite transporter (DMT)-like permease